jgi:hypothetical protein
VLAAQSLGIAFLDTARQAARPFIFTAEKRLMGVSIFLLK